MNSPIPEKLLAFVRSRIPMVEHDFAAHGTKETASHAAQRCAIGTYAITQAFFYAADLWVDKPPIVSVATLAYARSRWGDQADKVWTLKRVEIPKLDGCNIGKSGLIYEHVTTGGMFRRFIHAMLQNRSEVLDPLEVARWFENNFLTAWVTRDEDSRLTKAGHRSQRGETLDHALAIYRKCRIEIASRPSHLPCIVFAGDSVLEDEAVVDDDMAPVGEKFTSDQGDYSRYFEAVDKALQTLNPELSVRPNGNRSHAVLRGLDALGARDTLLLLDAPKGASVRTPTLSLEAITDKPGLEPSTHEWASLRDIAFGPEWQVSFGSADNKANTRCRCKRALTHAFDTTDATARQNAAERTAREVSEQWNAFHS